MASFSNDVRGEICCTVTDKDKKYACLYGIILFCRHISEKSVTINTESEKFFKLSCELIKSVFNRNIIFETEIIQKKKGNTGYYININDADSVRLIYEAYNINIEKREINLKNIVINSLNAFLAGVFLICGSVTDPEKEYHLEFTLPCEQLYFDLDKLLLSLGISSGRTERKKNTVLYIKDSENIEDILTFIGARQCTLNLMNIKIFKDVRNKVNRIANCDAANIDKVIAAAVPQPSLAALDRHRQRLAQLRAVHFLHYIILLLHDNLRAPSFDLFVDLPVHLPRGRVLLGGIGKTTEPLEAYRTDKFAQLGKLLLRLGRESGDQRRAQHHARHLQADLFHQRRKALRAAAPVHEL